MPHQTTPMPTRDLKVEAFCGNPRDASLLPRQYLTEDFPLSASASAAVHKDQYIYLDYIQ